MKLGRIEPFSSNFLNEKLKQQNTMPKKHKALPDVPPIIREMGYGKSKEATLKDGKSVLDALDKKMK